MYVYTTTHESYNILRSYDISYIVYPIIFSRTFKIPIVSNHRGEKKVPTAIFIILFSFEYLFDKFEIY